MDEEELEQPSSKINVGSFFERVDSVDRVANRALSQSSSNLGIINNQKLIIQSLSVSIEAMETKIRDIANYIIIEKKAEKDAAEDKKLEQEDKEQKQSMLERALKGDTGPKGDPGKPAEEQKGGGGFLGGLLKGLATLGISAFALKYIGPVLLPKLLLLAKTKLIPIIGTALKGGFVKLAALIGKVITGLVAKIPFVGKALAGSALFTGVGAAIVGIGNFISNALSGKGGGGGGAVSDSNVGITDPTVETGMADTMKEKDLVEEEEVESESNDINVKGEFKEGSYEFSSSEKDGVTTISSKFEGQTRFDMKTGKTYILGEEVTAEGYNEYKALPERKQYDKDEMVKIIEKHAVNKVEPVKENVNIQVQKQDKDLSLLDDTNARVDRIVQSTTDAGNIDQNQGVIVPRNTSQTSEATIKLAKSDVKFVQLTSNPYISISPQSKGLPPEVLRRLS
jgi:hypothetical protein